LEVVLVEQVFFYILATLIIASALMVVTRRNPVTAVIWLLVAFFGVAGIFALLGAHFLAAMQILLYAGAILVLFIFVIMMLNISPKATSWRIFSTRPMIFGSAAVYLFAVLGLVLWFVKARPVDIPVREGTVESVGRLLLTTYVVPFELTAVLILVAIVGAVSLSKRGR
jgi:NADH-quinone oxidoreductase subunit J